MMAADVSSLIGILNGADATDSPKPTALITRDLLGGCSPLDSKELDLDMQVPSGWEKRLDLKSGKVYLQRCDSSNSSSSSEHKKRNNGAVSKLQDLNLPPTAKQPMNLFDDSCLELKLLPSSSSAASPASSSNYQSVCTLDKVKSALERAEKETMIRKRSVSMSKSSSSPSPLSNSSSSIKDSEVEVEDEEKSAAASFAAGCPNCLLYVLISSNNPKCPRCSITVPLASAVKKPRIDLNISI